VPPFAHVACHGLLGTYDDGREWLKQAHLAARPKTILHLGSSIGNFSRDEAAEFLAGFADVMQPTDSIMMGIDSCNDPEKIYHAYNDKEGLTHQFTLNGLTHANEVLGRDAFRLDEWQAVGEYIFDDEGGRHQAFVSPVRETEALGVVVQPHERIQIEQSLKYSPAGYKRLFAAAGLEQVQHWSRGDEYGEFVLLLCFFEVATASERERVVSLLRGGCSPLLSIKRLAAGDVTWRLPRRDSSA
jgi:EasF-like predicted methyltransferase